MAMVETNLTLDGKPLSYEVLAGDSGYMIYLDGTPWIKQDSFIPFKKGTMAESCLAHIQELVDSAEQALQEVADIATAHTRIDAIEEAMGEVMVMFNEMMLSE